MTIDVRAIINCSLGPVISASINDEYIQNVGLIKTSGSCEIAGLVSPPAGTSVTFQYTKKGLTRTIPRALRVLSSFADPFRLITSVELGCKLTYLQDLTDPIDWDALDDPNNSELTEEDQRIVVLPIYASSVANKCLQELGISASSMPLTNRFSIPSFDFSSGYVDILSNLLVSESYCGYLDKNEVLQIFSLDQQGGSGAALAESSLIDISPVGVGQLPGEAVVVSYSTLKLQNPDVDDSEDAVAKRNWELEESESAPIEVFLKGEYFPAFLAPVGEWEKSFTYSVSTRTVTEYDEWDRVTKRTTTETSSTVAVNPEYVSQLISMNSPIAASGPATKISVTTMNYKYRASGERKEGYEEVLSEVTETSESEASILSGLQLNHYTKAVGTYFPKLLGQLATNPIFQTGITQRTTVTYDTASRFVSVRMNNGTLSNLGNFPVTKTSTKEEIMYARTSSGQNYLTSLIEEDPDENYLEVVSRAGRLVDVGTSFRTVAGREATLQSRPGLDVGGLADGGDPDNGYRTSASSDLVLSLGSASSQRRIEFSLPYAPDDIFSRSGLVFTSTPSDAPAKAKKFGIVQNRILLGTRQGMSIQVEPERIPSEPFAPLYIQARSLTALYRINGMSWVMDSNGIIASTDALYWGTASG